MPTPNQNVTHLQQGLSDLSREVGDLAKEVHTIPMMLTTFDTRVTKLESRVDRIEQTGRESLQWSNDMHAKIVDQMHTSLTAIEGRLSEKIEGLATKSWEQRASHLIATFGWIVAIALFLAGYIFNYLLSHH